VKAQRTENAVRPGSDAEQILTPVVILNWHKRCSELRAINYSEQLLGGNYEEENLFVRDRRYGRRAVICARIKLAQTENQHRD
jgi:hypothetical protein